MSRTVEAAEPETSPALLYADAAAAEAFGHRLLVAHDLPEQDAARVAYCLVRADLRGHDTHGLQTLPHYLNRLRRKLINPRPQLTVKRVTPMVGSLDGQDAFGFVVATKGMDEAMAMAREFGVGIVSAYHAQESATRVIYDVHQMLAAMGMTLEHSLHLWTYRLKALLSEQGGRGGQALAVAQTCFAPAARVSGVP